MREQRDGDGGDPRAEATPADGAADSLSSLLGGRRAAFDATLPAVAYVLGWLLTGRSIAWGGAAAVLAGLVAGALRWRAGTRPLAAVLGLLGVVVAVLVALRTGDAADFFLLQLASNVASALVWTGSIVAGWPLLGVVVGSLLLRQRGRWRTDRALRRGYRRASWVWVGQYLVRVAVFGSLWASGEVIALGAARVALSWPLVAACVAVSWWVLRRTLPAGHPGLRAPQEFSP